MSNRRRWLWALSGMAGFLMGARGDGCQGVDPDSIDGDLRYRQVSEVTGVVRAARSGVPVVEAMVRIGHEMVSTEADGYFVIDGLTVGNYIMMVTADGYQDLLQDIDLAVGANALGVLELTQKCLDGYGDCNEVAADGCETFLRDSHDHCGMCGYACALDQECVSAACSALICSPGTADCNHDVRDGCEVKPEIDAENCGACGHACGTEESCFASVCMQVIEESAGGLQLIGIDDMHLYWRRLSTEDSLGNTRADGALARWPLVGGSVEVLVFGMKSIYLYDAMMNSMMLYWINHLQTPMTIEYVSKQGGAIGVLSQTAFKDMIAVDDRFVYITANDQCDILKLNAQETSDPIYLASGYCSSISWNSDADLLYFTGFMNMQYNLRAISKNDGSTIGEWVIGGGIIDGAIVSGGVAYSKGDVYHDGSMRTMVFERPLDSSSEVVALDVFDRASGTVLCADTGGVFWEHFINDVEVGPRSELKRMVKANHSISTIFSTRKPFKLLPSGKDLFLAVDDYPIAGKSTILKYSLPSQ